MELLWWYNILYIPLFNPGCLYNVGLPTVWVYYFAKKWNFYGDDKNVEPNWNQCEESHVKNVEMQMSGVFWECHMKTVHLQNPIQFSGIHLQNVELQMSGIFACLLFIIFKWWYNKSYVPLFNLAVILIWGNKLFNDLFCQHCGMLGNMKIVHKDVCWFHSSL